MRLTFFFSANQSASRFLPARRSPLDHLNHLRDEFTFVGQFGRRQAWRAAGPAGVAPAAPTLQNEDASCLDLACATRQELAMRSLVSLAIPLLALLVLLTRIPVAQTAQLNRDLLWATV